MSTEETFHPWIERLNAGDSAAAEHVFVSLEPSLRIVIRRGIGRKLRAKVDSTDIVQSVFADFLESVRHKGCRFEARPQVRAYLQRIAWRRLSDHARKHKASFDREASLDTLSARSLPAAHEPRPSEAAQGQELWERALEACPPQHREIIRLRRDGIKIAEIARIVGLHEGSVRRIVYDLARKLAISRKGPLGSSDKLD